MLHACVWKLQTIMGVCLNEVHMGRRYYLRILDLLVKHALCVASFWEALSDHNYCLGIYIYIHICIYYISRESSCLDMPVCQLSHEIQEDASAKSIKVKQEYNPNSGSLGFRV